METANRGVLVGLGLLILATAVGAWVWLRDAEPETETWQPAVEGFLAVATPCCEEASLWSDLSVETDDGQRGRPATAEETAVWLDTWPYRERGEEEVPEASELKVSMRSSEVRCVGPASGADVPRNGDDAATVEALRNRRECSYARWRVWAEETAEDRLNERHTVWADEDGLFHGRVDYWKAE